MGPTSAISLCSHPKGLGVLFLGYRGQGVVLPAILPRRKRCLAVKAASRPSIFEECTENRRAEAHCLSLLSSSLLPSLFPPPPSWPSLLKWYWLLRFIPAYHTGVIVIMYEDFLTDKCGWVNWYLVGKFVKKDFYALELFEKNV
ncbi:hypothetical protein COP2_033676 [Malus domestica]|uniref:Uncharacterized protein n=1 Tax=Malus domestica TaxID=3750 RepID=A0A498K895_MALDO|nr:hypothetical protein DVH24_026665 [Malus domestica]